MVDSEAIGMMSKKSVREWFGATRSAADGAAKALAGASTAKAVGDVELRILLRQYLCDRLPALIVEADGVSADEAERMRRQIYSEIIEDAIAGVWTADENSELVMFLYECTSGVEAEEVFSALLGRILVDDIPDGAVDAVRAAADAEMREFADSRRRNRLQPPEPEPSAAWEDESEPPPWLDEFEYIDWLMTH